MLTTARSSGPLTGTKSCDASDWWGHHVSVFECGPPDDGPGADRGLEVPREAAEVWWNSERAGLHDWLNGQAPHLAPLYLAGLRMAMDERFPGRVHFIAHAVREIRNRLPDALDGDMERAQVDYRRLVDEVHKLWTGSGFPRDGSGPTLTERLQPSSATAGVVVPSELAAAIAELMKQHSEAEANKGDLEALRFEALAGPGPHPQYVSDGWKRTHRLVQKFAHAWNRELPPEADAEWTDRFLAFERFLIVISKRAQENIADLDELLREANSR